MSSASSVLVAPGELAGALRLARGAPRLDLELLPGRHRTGLRLTRSVRISAQPGAVLLPPRDLRSFFRVESPASGAAPVVEFEGLSFRGGVAWKGASFRVMHGQLKMKNCEFSVQRSIAEGGSVWVDSGASLVLEDCRFSRGRALAGGAIYVAPGGRLEAVDCRFEGNRGRCGGAVALEAAQGRLERCHFDGNRVANCGPALAGRGLGSASATGISLGTSQPPPALQAEDDFFSLELELIN